MNIRTTTVTDDPMLLLLLLLASWLPGLLACPLAGLPFYRLVSFPGPFAPPVQLVCTGQFHIFPPGMIFFNHLWWEIYGIPGLCLIWTADHQDHPDGCFGLRLFFFCEKQDEE